MRHFDWTLHVDGTKGEETGVAHLTADRRRTDVTVVAIDVLQVNLCERAGDDP